MRDISQNTKAVAALFDASDRRAPGTGQFAVQPNSPLRMPTAEAYGTLQSVCDEFNSRHFGNSLPNVMITFTRRANVLGYFCAEAFRDQNGATAHEIALNPMWFDPNDDMPVFRTIMHEMVHLWRHLFGGLNRKGGVGAPGYHDVVWADKMVEIGLMPSDTGLPGGNRTGFRMGDYLIEGSPFDLTCRELVISGVNIDWRDRTTYRQRGAEPSGTAGDTAEPNNRRSKRQTRTSFMCACCQLKAWSRASAKLSCNDCNAPMLAR